MDNTTQYNTIKYHDQTNHSLRPTTCIRTSPVVTLTSSINEQTLGTLMSLERNGS